jgi:hypothetical protein
MAPGTGCGVACPTGGGPVGGGLADGGPAGEAMGCPAAAFAGVPHCTQNAPFTVAPHLVQKAMGTSTRNGNITYRTSQNGYGHQFRNSESGKAYGPRTDRYQKENACSAAYLKIWLRILPEDPLGVSTSNSAASVGAMSFTATLP